jgi:hypothetical protein
MAGRGFIACFDLEDTIRHYGEGCTPSEALDDFVNGGGFKEYCSCVLCLDDGTTTEVKVFTAIYRDAPEADIEHFDGDWEWMLGDEVSKHEVVYCG